MVNLSNFYLVVAIASFISITIGCLLHFLFDWTHHNKFVAIFSAINESTWEHVKIGFSGLFAWFLIVLCDMIICRLFGLENCFLFPINFDSIKFSNFIIATATSFLMLFLGIVLPFYLYKAISKRHILWLDIFIFCIAMILGQFAFYCINIQTIVTTWPTIIIVLALIVNFLTLFFYFTGTFFPLKMFLFKDIRNNKFGFSACKSYKRKSGKRKK